MGAENCAYNMQKRKESFAYAHLLLSGFNKIAPTMYMDEETVPMSYPIVIEEDECVQWFFRAKHFPDHWWSYVCDEQPEENFEHWISRYVIPITINQRYYKEEIENLVNIIKKK